MQTSGTQWRFSEELYVEGRKINRLSFELQTRENQIFN